MISSSTISRHVRFLLQQSTTITHLFQIHSLILKTSINHNHVSLSQFISSFCEISIDYARSIFDHLPFTPPITVWNSMIRGYSKSPAPSEAIKLFLELRRVGIEPDNFTYPFVIKACGRSSMLGEGETMHCLVLKTGFVSVSYVGNALLHMYAVCGLMGVARKVFDEISKKDVVTWSSLIAGYVSWLEFWLRRANDGLLVGPLGVIKDVHHIGSKWTVICVNAVRRVALIRKTDLLLEALMVFRQMKSADVKPNSVTLVSLLSACTHLGSPNMGESVHLYIVVNKIELDVALGTALVAMYSKCGHIEKAFQVFTCMTVKNLQTWTVMISGLADHGRGKDAVSLFTKMEMSGLKPDSVSFSGILSACSHLGLVNEGQWYFDRMISMYNVQPTMEHYGCMVDLFGRAGLVEEAYGFIRNMPVEPNSVILRSFIGACKNHGQIFHVDGNLMKLLLEVEPDLGSNYVLAANVSAVSGCWDDVAWMRRTMTRKGLKKVPGSSWMEVNRRYVGCIADEIVNITEG